MCIYIYTFNSCILKHNVYWCIMAQISFFFLIDFLPTSKAERNMYPSTTDSLNVVRGITEISFFFLKFFLFFLIDFLHTSKAERNMYPSTTDSLNVVRGITPGAHLRVSKKKSEKKTLIECGFRGIYPILVCVQKKKRLCECSSWPCALAMYVHVYAYVQVDV